MMNEVLYGIRVIKFYTWEKHFTNKVDDLRSLEVDSLRGIKYLDAMCVYFWATTPVLISILSFTTYATLGHQLTAAKVNMLALTCKFSFEIFCRFDFCKKYCRAYFGWVTEITVSRSKNIEAMTSG